LNKYLKRQEVGAQKLQGNNLLHVKIKSICAALRQKPVINAFITVIQTFASKSQIRNDVSLLELGISALPLNLELPYTSAARTGDTVIDLIP
jgi:hypothetical protein